MNANLMEPLKFYEKEGKALHDENAKALFEKLLAESKVDVEENRKTVKEYNKECGTVRKLERKVGGRKALRGFFIFLIIAGGLLFVLSLVGLFALGLDVITGIILTVVGAALVGVLIPVIVKVLNPAIKRYSELLGQHRSKRDDLYAKASEQMQPLNDLFTKDMSFELIEKTVPEFEFDEYFARGKEDLFERGYDFSDYKGDQSSIIQTLTGRFAKNPFLYTNGLFQEMITEHYFGSLTISWTETQYDSNGRPHTVVRTQTLNASVSKPKPNYYNTKKLFYGCQAAPDLSFYRTPQHWERLSEGARMSKVRRGAKKIRKQARKAMKKGSDFQEMLNEEFDVLFGATDRDHEVQFRLMYTPLAQENTIQSLTSKTGYGDDFHFRKVKRLNIITSEHAQNWNMDTSPVNYYSIDVDDCRARFVNFNNEYFKSLFFDFLPLISVPAYAEKPVKSLEPLEEYDSNYSVYEHEAVANAIGSEYFAHPDTATFAILKSQFLSKDGDTDHVSVRALSFRAENRVDFVPVWGGDGNVHEVPVPWIEYIPIERTSTMDISPDPTKRKTYSSCGGEAFFHGLRGRIN